MQLTPAKGPTNWKYAREAITESRRYGPEPIMNLILTDMEHRNPKLAEHVERICEAVVREAIETDEYFGRLVELTPDYWNERVYKPRINKFKACLEKLFDKLSHIRHLLEKDLTTGKRTGPRGRPKKHSEDTVKAAETLFNELQGEGKSVNECWFEVHKKLSFKSPVAAKQAVYRYNQQNKKRN